MHSTCARVCDDYVCACLCVWVCVGSDCVHAGKLSKKMKKNRNEAAVKKNCRLTKAVGWQSAKLLCASYVLSCFLLALLNLLQNYYCRE